MGDKKVFGFAGWSGSGKTTLIEQLIPRIRARGLRVSLIKHSHHAVDIDIPGKDSHRHRMAGCEEVLISASSRWALIRELRGAPELTLDEAIATLSPCDLVLVEGYKFAPLPKLEIFRAGLEKPLLCTTDSEIVALATDAPKGFAAIPQFELHEYDEIINFIINHVGLTQRSNHR
jgi:molybdopterin-guanine dinucleotide biosynthesis adapter protein